MKDRTRRAIREALREGDTPSAMMMNFDVPRAFVEALEKWQLFEDPADSAPTADPAEGQIWQDRDPRFQTRRVRIVGIFGEKVGYRSVPANRLAYSQRARFLKAFSKVENLEAGTAAASLSQHQEKEKEQGGFTRNEQTS